VAIFGRMTARQRLRRATRESLAIPAFSSPIDCTPWVTGGLWPAELSPADPETATIAEYLRNDLERIARSANDELKVIKRSGLTDPARQAGEARVIDEARARAVQRVESTIRQLHAMPSAVPRSAGPFPGPDVETTQVIPAVTELEPVAAAPAEVARERRWRASESRRRDTERVPATPQIDDTLVIPAVTEDNPTPPQPPVPAELPVPAAEQEPVADEPEPVADETEPATPPRGAVDGAPAQSVVNPPALEVGSRQEPDSDRLNRLLEFVVRQESRLNWAVGEQPDGTTVVVTDLAHGWIPPGISLPAGARLLEPGRRSGRPAELIGETARVVTYAPGDSLRRSADLATTTSSLQPRELPAIDDLAGVLSAATHRRDGLPPMAHAMASTAAAGTRIVDQEVDVLRVQLDTARYRLLVQYPKVDPRLLLNCLLLAATEAFVIGDAISANYHLRWFQELQAPPSS
jgi:uncharacterized protein DUF5631/uncharacterized protein DUF5632